MRDILDELGLNFGSHQLEYSLEYAIKNYTDKQCQFHEALSSARQAFTLKSEAVPVKSFINYNSSAWGIDGTFTEQFMFWQQIKDFIKSHENDDWEFSHFVKDSADIINDPYEDDGDFREQITVYAWIKSENQPTTEEQDNAILMVKSTEQDLISAKKLLEMEIKNAK